MVPWIIIWAVVVAISFVIEFFTTDFSASCIAIGGLVALILACIPGVAYYIQIPVFIVVGVVAIIFVRPLFKKWLIKNTVPTNLDKNFGKTTKLLADVVDGQSQIKINDIVWTAVCAEELHAGDLVEIQSTEGNKMIVKGVKK